MRFDKVGKDGSPGRGTGDGGSVDRIGQSERLSIRVEVNSRV